MLWILATQTDLIRMEARIMAQLQQQIDTITSQLNKALDEIKAANPDVDLTALEQVARALDDLNPDQVPEPPAE